MSTESVISVGASLPGAALRAEWERNWTHIMGDAQATEEFVDRLLAALEAGRDETAWLIEGQASGRPVWWTGKWYPRGARIVYGPLHSAYVNPTSTTDMEPEFSPDHAEALRFARQRDAERAVGLLPVFYHSAIHVNEHAWVSARGEFLAPRGEEPHD